MEHIQRHLQLCPTKTIVSHLWIQKMWDEQRFVEKGPYFIELCRMLRDRPGDHAGPSSAIEM